MTKQINLFEEQKVIPQSNGLWFLYVLLCENDFYYVGITLYPERRLKQHFNREGANFTKRNKPKKIIEIECLNSKNRKDCYKKETLKTKEYRIKFGKDKVVGGKLLSLDLRK